MSRSRKITSQIKQSRFRRSGFFHGNTVRETQNAVNRRPFNSGTLTKAFTMNEILSVQTADFETGNRPVAINDEPSDISYADFEATMTYIEYLRFHDDMI